MRILLKYEPMPTVFFGDSWEYPYELTIKNVFFFGLIERIKKVTYTISMFQSIKNHTDHWDELIKTQNRIR